MKTVIKVKESEVRISKSEGREGENYKLITFREATLVQTPFGLMPKPDSQCRERAIVIFETNFGKPSVGYADPTFKKNAPQEGGWFVGSIETRKVTPYNLPVKTKEGMKDRQANLYTTVVFGESDSPSFNDLVVLAFKQHPIVDATPVKEFAPAGGEGEEGQGELAGRV